MIEPLAIYSFTITTADALAWESRPGASRRVSGWLLVLLAFVGAGLAVLLRSEWLSGWRFLLVALGVAAVVLAVWTVVLTVHLHQRARRRVPGIAEITIEDWGDSFTITGDGARRHVALEAMSEVISTSTHSFLVYGPDVIILPRSAFESGVLEALESRIVAAHGAS